MQALVATCGSARVRQSLAPWLAAAQQRAAAEQPTAASDLAVVVVAGATGTGKRRLVAALSGHGVDAIGSEVAGVIETKYYSTRVAFKLVDLTDTTADDALPCGAQAYVLLWDTARPETLSRVRAAGQRFVRGSEDEEDAILAEGDEDVRLCVAVDNPNGEASATAAAQEEADEAARAWCADAGFEHLRCAFGAGDLAEVARRREASCAAAANRLLGSDTDGTAERILEALECHPWPEMELKRDRKKTAEPRAAPSAEAADGRARGDAEGCCPPPAGGELPTVVALGPARLGGAGLLRALAGGQSSVSGEVVAVVRTKYYAARVRCRAVDAPETLEAGFPSEAVGALRAATGVILLFDARSLASFAVLRTMWEAQQPEPAEPGEDDGPSNCSRAAGVRLCVAVGDAGTDAPTDVRMWCLENGFEFLHCSLADGNLEALRTRWRSGAGAGASLLGAEGEDAAASPVRIAEALESFMWPNLELVQGKQTESAGGACQDQPAEEESCTDAGRAAGEPGKSTLVQETETGAAEGSAMAVDAMERLSDEIRAVRGTADEQLRRERACDVALRLAQALGVDSDSD